KSTMPEFRSTLSWYVWLRVLRNRLPEHEGVKFSLSVELNRGSECNQEPGSQYPHRSSAEGMYVASLSFRRIPSAHFQSTELIHGLPAQLFLSDCTFRLPY